MIRLHPRNTSRTLHPPPGVCKRGHIPPVQQKSTPSSGSSCSSVSIRVRYLPAHVSVYTNRQLLALLKTQKLQPRARPRFSPDARPHIFDCIPPPSSLLPFPTIYTQTHKNTGGREREKKKQETKKKGEEKKKRKMEKMREKERREEKRRRRKAIGIRPSKNAHKLASAATVPHTDARRLLRRSWRPGSPTAA